MSATAAMSQRVRTSSTGQKILASKKSVDCDSECQPAEIFQHKDNGEMENCPQDKAAPTYEKDFFQRMEARMVSQRRLLLLSARSLVKDTSRSTADRMRGLNLITLISRDILVGYQAALKPKDRRKNYWG